MVDEAAAVGPRLRDNRNECGDDGLYRNDTNYTPPIGLIPKKSRFLKQALMNRETIDKKISPGQFFLVFADNQ